MNQNTQHYKSLQQLVTEKVDFVTVLITKMQGSAPQEPGAKMLVISDCETSPYQGTIGGGKLELFAIEHAKKLLVEKTANTTESMTLNLQSDVGMTCGGVVQLFFEIHQQQHWNIAVFGAGHVAQALIPLLLTLNCQVYCIDSRKDWLDKLPDHLTLKKIYNEDLVAVLPQLPKDCFVVSVTRGHGEDVKIVKAIVNDRAPPFIGVIGSESKAAILKKELLALGLNSKEVDRLHCPIGLPFGKDIPAEIAVSISAQLLQVRGEI